MENHAVCIPFPAQGHIRPMLKLAQLLHFKFGFHITFINTHYIHKTHFQNHNSSSSNTDNNNNPTFRFESFPHQDNDSNDIISIIKSIVNNKLELPLKEILMSKCINNNSTTTTTTTTTTSWCMISDVGMSSFTLRVAQQLGIPVMLLETASACSQLAYFNYRELLDKGIIPLPDESCLTNGYLEKEIDWIPSLKGICLKDMPSFIRTMDANDMILNITMSNAHRALNSKAIVLVNTFDELEKDVLNEISTISSNNVYPIGPLNLMVDYHLSKNDIVSIGPTISSEKDHQQDYDQYMQWLDSQEPKSVLYISFGTIVGISGQETLTEFARGLANSHVKFLWILRRDLVIGEHDCAIFDDKFEEETKGRGLLVSWCDQERVLAHSSVGGFLTHCGWNSMIESISNGMPMICWPFASDQMTNSWYCCNCLGIGVKISEDVKQDEIERVVKELMQGEKGTKMRTKALEWKKLAREVVMNPNGSSYANLDHVINNVLKMQK